MSRLWGVAAALVLLVGAGCSSGGSSGDAKSTPDAASIVKSLAGKVSSAQPSVVFNASNDPNHLLGRSNGYRSKASWLDSRVNKDDTMGSDPGDTELGGSVEVFTSSGGAKDRRDYIQRIEKALPAGGAEYDYIRGGAVVRVSGLLTPDQAKEYQVALEKAW
jgi:hypothetical protein